MDSQDKRPRLEIQTKQLLRTKAKMNKILAERTGQPLERVEKDTERDYYMTAEEAKEYGLVDQVLEKAEPAKDAKK